MNNRVLPLTILLAAAASISLLWEFMLEQLPRFEELLPEIEEEVVTSLEEFFRDKAIEGVVDAPNIIEAGLSTSPPSEINVDGQEPESPLLSEPSNAGGNDAMEDHHQQEHSFEALFRPKAGAEASTNSIGSNQILRINDAAKSTIVTEPEKDHPQQLDNDKKTTGV